MRTMGKLKMASVFLAWLTEDMVVLVTEIRSLEGEEDDALDFQHVVLEIILRYISINIL